MGEFIHAVFHVDRAPQTVVNTFAAHVAAVAAAAAAGGLRGLLGRGRDGGLLGRGRGGGLGGLLGLFRGPRLC